jgi:hypothetical protein
MQAGLRDPEVLAIWCSGASPLQGHGDDVGTELEGKRFRHEI